MSIRYARRTTSAIALLVSSITSFPAAIGAASASESATDPALETVVVTAHRVPVPRPAAGSTVSGIERDLISARQSVFAADLLAMLPGVAVSRAAGAGSQTQVRVRGAEANHVLVVIDGVEANDPAGNDEFDFSALTAYDIEHIELVRGPQSALWGSDATAGILNVVTRGGRRPPALSGFVEGGALDTLRGGAQLSGANARGSAALGASYVESRGESAAASGSERDGYDNLTLTLNTRLNPSDTTRLGFSARHSAANTEYDGVDFATGLPADADLESEDELLLLKAEAGIAFFDERWDHGLKVTYLDSERRQFEAGARVASTAAEKLGVYYQSTLRLGGNAGTGPNASAAADSSHKLVLAVDHEDETFDQRGTATPFGDPNQQQTLDTTGFVAEWLLRPLAALDLSASLRHDDNSDFDDVTTYRLTGSYRIERSSTRLHASWGTGQKSPTFVERYGYFSDQFIGNPDLKPERSKGFDVGVEQWFAGERARVDLTWYDERLEDEIDGFAFDPDRLAFTAVNLDRESRRKGVELEASATITQNLTARLSFTYAESEQPDATGGSAREVRRPREQATLNFDQAFLDRRANLNLNVAYTGEQTDQYFPPPTFAAETVALDAYVRVDVAGSFALTPRIELTLRAENLFDEDYENVLGFAAPGRGVYAGIRMNAGN